MPCWPHRVLVLPQKCPQHPQHLTISTSAGLSSSRDINSLVFFAISPAPSTLNTAVLVLSQCQSAEVFIHTKLSNDFPSTQSKIQSPGGGWKTWHDLEASSPSDRSSCNKASLPHCRPPLWSLNSWSQAHRQMPLSLPPLPEMLFLQESAWFSLFLYISAQIQSVIKEALPDHSAKKNGPLYPDMLVFHKRVITWKASFSLSFLPSPPN